MGGERVGVNPIQYVGHLTTRKEGLLFHHYLTPSLLPAPSSILLDWVNSTNLYPSYDILVPNPSSLA